MGPGFLAGAPLGTPSSAPPANTRCGRCLILSRSALQLGLWLHSAPTCCRSRGSGRSRPPSARGLQELPLPSRGARVPAQLSPQRSSAAQAPHRNQLPRRRRVSAPALSRGRLDGGGGAEPGARPCPRPPGFLELPRLAAGSASHGWKVPRPAGLAQGWLRPSRRAAPPPSKAG